MGIYLITNEKKTIRLFIFIFTSICLFASAVCGQNEEESRSKPVPLPNAEEYETVWGEINKGDKPGDKLISLFNEDGSLWYEYETWIRLFLYLKLQRKGFAPFG
jgi:hypothetical protein